MVPDQVRDDLHAGLTLLSLPNCVQHFVYIMASRPGGAIYVGRTSRLADRVNAHRAGLSAHTAKYKINTLVWFEAHDTFEASLIRERRLKRWKRAWKNQLIFQTNPDWQDIANLIPV